jgi:hypothetical protein
MDKCCYGGNWHIRRDGKLINLNTEYGADFVGADFVLGLLEYIEEMEALLRRRERQRSKERKDGEEDD